MVGYCFSQTDSTAAHSAALYSLGRGHEAYTPRGYLLPLYIEDIGIGIGVNKSGYSYFGDSSALPSQA